MPPGLGHVLSISGLHMALVAGSTFWLLRALLRAVPGTRAAPAHQEMGGGRCAPRRDLLPRHLGRRGRDPALLIMLRDPLRGADRPAGRSRSRQRLRSPPSLVLLVEPESLLTASFQMSFAATLALVAGYEALGERAERRAAYQTAATAAGLAARRPPAYGLFLTSLIAGLATTPFATYHFQRGGAALASRQSRRDAGDRALVMPMALLSVVLMPFGLEVIPLSLMSWGIDWMMAVAERPRTWSGQGSGGCPASGGRSPCRRRLPLAGAVARALAPCWPRPISSRSRSLHRRRGRTS